MSKQLHTYRDKDLNLYQVNSNYILLLQIYPGSFSYAVIYKNRLSAWAEECDLKLLNDPGEEHDLLSYDYKHIVVGLHSTGFTLMPNVLFNVDKVTDIAYFLDVKSNEKVFTQALDDDNQIIYKVEETVIANAQKFDLQKAAYINKGWINAIANSNPPAYNIYININKTQAAVLYFAGGKIRFYNTFEFNNPDELAYYASFVTKELNLQPANINLVLSGDVTLGDKNTICLADFFNGVEMNLTQILDLPIEISSYKILPLAALSLCVSSEVF